MAYGGFKYINGRRRGTREESRKHQIQPGYGGPDGDDDLDNDADESSSPHTSRAPSSVGATDSDGDTRLDDATLDPEDFDFSLEPSGAHPTAVVEGTVVNFSSIEATAPVAEAAYLEMKPLRGTAGVMVAALNPPPPSAEEQAQAVRELQSDEELTELKPAQTRFVISNSWMRRWRDYVGMDDYSGICSERRSTVDPPGPIMNKDILEADRVTLKEYCRLHSQFVSKPLWELLSGWYGGIPIERPVVREFGHPTVELHPMKIKLSRAGLGTTVVIEISMGCTMGHLKRKGAAALQMGPVEECAGLRIDEMCGCLRLRELDVDNDDQLLADTFNSRNVTLQFHTRDLPEDDDSEEDTYSTNLNSKWRSDYLGSSRVVGTPGAVGLNNLGNTCFMNAAIQCLSHIPEVVEYFGKKDGHRQLFLEDLNLDNPLGTHGELAKAFGNLVMGMWSGKERCIYPRDFRNVLCNHAQQFLGYDQHDSQEFLAYLLDGIHEDVNRVREKPFVEKVEASTGECDQTAARRAWEAHLRRNDSFIVDTMHGQYKSVVTCPVEGCGKTSTTFDPAMYLSVPLPVVEDRSVEVVLARLDGSRPTRYGLFVSKTARLKELRQALSMASGVREDRLAFTDVWQHKFHAELEDDQTVSSIRGDDVVVFELPTWPKPPPLPVDQLRSTCVVGGKQDDGDDESRSATRVPWEEKISPFLLVAEREKELRDTRDAAGRWRLLRRAQAYLDRFPSAEEIAEFTRRQDSESESRADGAGDGDSVHEGIVVDLKTRLRDASDYSCSFMELNTVTEVEAFREAVGCLRALVEHEQPEFKVQIIQHRSWDLETYSSRYRSYVRTTAFSFPAMLSFLPHSTTVREFREMITALFRRFVRPRDPDSHTSKDSDCLDPGNPDGISGGGLDASREAEGAEEDGRTRAEEPGRGDPENVERLLRSGQLGLFPGTTSFSREERNILASGGDRDGDLISKWIDDTPDRTPKLVLKWSDDAVQEAYDGAEVQEVVDDPSVAECRDREPKTLSISMCLERFLEREQLDETEMWYCSSCKEHRRAYKEMSLWRLPQVLVLHLKRFSYTYGGWTSSGEKIESFVTFPVRGLDMRHLERVSRARNRGRTQKTDNASTRTAGFEGACGSEDSAMDDWVVVNSQRRAPHEGSGGSSLNAANDRKEDAKGGSDSQWSAQVVEHDPTSTPGDEVRGEDEDVYDLWGVVNHHGMLNGGHYTALALNEQDGRWYDFSDTQVSAVDRQEDLVTAAAYVLFYRRRGTTAKVKEDGAGGDGGIGGGGGDGGVGGAAEVFSKDRGGVDEAGTDRGHHRRVANVVL